MAPTLKKTIFIFLPLFFLLPILIITFSNVTNQFQPIPIEGKGIIEEKNTNQSFVCTNELWRWSKSTYCTFPQFIKHTISEVSSWYLFYLIILLFTPTGIAIGVTFFLVIYWSIKIDVYNKILKKLKNIS